MPLVTARLCLQAIELAEEAAMTGNRNSISDGGVGALLAKAGLESALLNVRINLPSVREGAFKAATIAEIAELQTKSARSARKNTGRCREKPQRLAAELSSPVTARARTSPGGTTSARAGT